MTTRTPSAATAEGMPQKPAADLRAPIATNFDFKQAFQDLEDLVNRVSMATQLASYLAHEDMKFAKDGSFTATQMQGDFIQFAARIAEDYAGRLHDQWMAAHNAAGNAEWAAAGLPVPGADQ